MQKDIIIWGAGKIGRGFIADLFYQAGYAITFVDAEKTLVEKLREQPQYTVVLLPSDVEQHEHTIQGYQAYHTDEQEQILAKMSSIPLLAVAVFPTAFEATAQAIAAGIEKKAHHCRQTGTMQPLDILLCANISHPAQTFRTLLESNLSETGKTYLQQHVGLIDAIILRMGLEPSPELKARDPLAVLTNGYPEIPVDKPAFKGPALDVPGIVLSDNLAAEETRKMYTYNMIHAVYAYLGSHRGYEYIIDCIRDEEIQRVATGCVEEISQALQTEHGFSAADMDAWNDLMLKNMANPMLKDRVDRVGADPVRKLRRDDRLTGPALLCRKHGILPYYLATAIAHAFLFDPPGDADAERLRQTLATTDIHQAIRTFCQLDHEVELIQLIAKRYASIARQDALTAREAQIATIKRAYHLGFHYEKTYKGCAQCTLATMFDITGKQDKSVFKAASGLAGGIGLCGDGVCGGYSGGVMFMSFLIGRRLDHFGGDSEAKNRSFAMAQRLHDKFLETYGTVICKGIHQEIFGAVYILRDKTVRDAFEAAGAHEDKCTTVVACAAQWVTEILFEEGLL
ncbi:hypothetical protein GF339_16820 [candidate division KSB3 bacterium]|uniref:Mannitol dehydrogenase C-terminal domain-containing protein n=1 Tax=candidate division KSB3 bacterium TaxID=2044937 RepID=A0A9D5Q7U3_9BACT|nr:hypothetical protein [candidate division KSB3 bacterium]MBD3326251.1 hypothetical protein [candidate division KSB3 bacterium]